MAATLENLIKGIAPLRDIFSDLAQQNIREEFKKKLLTQKDEHGNTLEALAEQYHMAPEELNKRLDYLVDEKYKTIIGLYNALDKVKGALGNIFPTEKGQEWKAGTVIDLLRKIGTNITLREEAVPVFAALYAIEYTLDSIVGYDTRIYGGDNLAERFKGSAKYSIDYLTRQLRSVAGMAGLYQPVDWMLDKIGAPQMRDRIADAAFIDMKQWITTGDMPRFYHDELYDTMISFKDKVFPEVEKLSAYKQQPQPAYTAETLPAKYMGSSYQLMPA